MENKRKISFRRGSFVKVLDDNYTEKLAMPPSFVNIFEGEIPPWFILEISGSRKCWRVDVENDENGRVYLSYGFNCFIKAHSLEAGNFLLFEYEKPSILQVKIYEKDGSERANESTFELEYEIRASESPKQTPKIHEGRPTESPRQTSIIHVGGYAEFPRQTPIFNDVGYSETPRQPQIIREVGPFDSAKQSMKVHQEELTLWTALPSKSRIHEGERSESPRHPPIVHEGEHAGTPRQLPKIREVGRSEFLRQTPGVQEKQVTPWPRVPSIRYGACEIQRNVINTTKRKKCMMTATGQNACFSLTWRKASHFLYYVTIPKPILVGKTYSNKETVLLKDTEGNSWPMELRVRQDGRVDLAKGWREFVNDSDLMTGDVLIFEFLSNNMIQVQVVRANQVVNPSEREQDRKIEPKQLFNTPLTVGNARVASEIKSSSFSVTWSLLSRNTYLNIPKAIAIKQKLVDKDIVVLCDPEGRKWSIGVRTRPSDGRIGLGHGLSDFLKAYGIDVGDTLIFEFVTERMIKVHIIKACGLNHFVSGASVKQELVSLDLPMEVGPWLIHDAPEDLNHV
ncbi:uncharacterized protein LOC130815229 isoform X2 [Amaranthus tricolor]|uniref:uncharacterized protein LOC130815229 isoform X2 n=1 Tax=Amaranthus tricolor TaxID=29722 RepID=UPI00258346C4|nr:uncharacterized protein LOC130815229 isoform X2 [Amaranthus tricolor]